MSLISNQTNPSNALSISSPTPEAGTPIRARIITESPTTTIPDLGAAAEADFQVERVVAAVSVQEWNQVNRTLKHKYETTTGKKPESVQDVSETMHEMDRLNKTSFSNWIRSESNLTYLVTFKGEMILEYLAADPKSAITALEWIIQDWSTESVAEIVLKFFYQLRIDSLVFSERLWGMIKSWSADRMLELIPILLIGESIDTCARFFGHFSIVSGKSNDEITALAMPIAYGFKWTPDDLTTFLVGIISVTVADSVLQRSLEMVVEDEMKMAAQGDVKSEGSHERKCVLNAFEMLLQIVLDQHFTADI